VSRERELPGVVADLAPAPPRGASGVERIVAIALAAMAVVLLLVWVDLLRTATGGPVLPFDWQNPLLDAQPGECVEVSDASLPGEKVWLVVREPGVVLRPDSGPAAIEGWRSVVYPDPRRFPPYLVCEARRAPAPGAAAAQIPPSRSEALVFPLNGFGMPLEALCALNDMQTQAIDWAGQRHRGYAVGLRRYGKLEGPWILYMSKDAPVLGTTKRVYFHGRDEMTQSFLVPEGCR
jgi:hypothetical protein